MIGPHSDARTLRIGIGAVVGFFVVLVALVLVLPAVLAGPASPPVGVATSTGSPSPTRTTADACAAGGNPIVCENSKPGARLGDWQVTGAGDPGIQGFATDISVNAGSRIDFKIDTKVAAYTIDVFRTGWYDGLGARKIVSVPVAVPLPQVQPVCAADPATGLVDCGNWAVSAGWDVPADAVSGVYVARLRRSDTGGASHITFVVRNDASHSDLVFQTSDTTWQAYNTYGGTSLYVGGPNGRGYKVSYNRPFSTRAAVEARDFYFGNEFPMVRFLERNGYDVTYLSGVDTDRSGALLKNHKVFLSVGHDEYWSGPQRANVEAARDAGVNLAFFSGNEGFWRTRFEGSVAGPATDRRTLVSYKETRADSKIDPSAEWTGTWRDPRFAPPSAGGGRPENAVSGTQYMANSVDLAVTVSAAEGRLRLWRNTNLTSIPEGGVVALASHTVGYESNEDVDNGSRPAGLFHLSTTTGQVPEYLQDFGTTVLPGTTTHHVSMYRASSGALVFSAGSIQWSWGLDPEHDGNGAPADARIQQATVNVFADMGVQPSSLIGELVAGTPSSDTSPPSATITAPDNGIAIANGTSVTVRGTATDAGGGRVAGVEVSTDAGATWHPATGTDSWRYTYVQGGMGTISILARAVDDSANLGVASAPRGAVVNCPCSVLGDTVPSVAATDQATGQELGLRVTATANGFITGVRFYRGQGNDGPHTGSLWSAAGRRLASVDFTAETPTGWQTAAFATPVAVTAGQTYLVSYTAPQGHFAVVAGFFAAAGITAGPLTAAGGYGTPPAGVFGAPGTFPGSSYHQNNYFVDAVFSTTRS